MTANPLVRPGSVEWTGDNPFIYLSPDGSATNWSTLALFFRVAVSPHGPGRMAVILEAPYVPDPPEACRLCLTDNEALAEYLVDGFVRRFPLFRPVPDLGEIPVVTGATSSSEGDGRTWWQESLRARDGNLTVKLRWTGLSTPFAVVVPPEHSATGGHEMLSVFAPATSASVSVNGRRLPGEPVERELFNRPAQSAALALSETWIRAERDEP